ncbi:AraC family transcriptional regulator [Rhizobium rhizogenes]|uniref:AraC family transcriptional regulator n=1 Tax=Rhizobium rhizogenes TaxID=359 RepID=UPI0022B5E923|nr:AraC family transcriptional regulator [Rhizobium rhizogenes]MCZ7448208.1 AraC family transcriptional regulator [Rhizobium rhizogenes]MCZ7465869.1 AraC family transcriptional regulator [Rhizobium rhizogenes]
MRYAPLLHLEGHEAAVLHRYSRDQNCEEERHYIVGRFSAWMRSHQTTNTITLPGTRGVYALYLPRHNVYEAEAGASHLTPAQTSGFLGEFPHVEKLICLEGRSYIVMTFERSAMVCQLSELLDTPITQDVEFDRVVDLTTVRGSRLVELANLVWHCLDVSEEHRMPSAAIERLFQATMIALLKVVPNNYLPRLSGPVSPAVPWYVKKSIEYMHANLSRPLTISLIARETGTSVRALQMAFQQFRGTTPLSYLRTIRLEAARKTLLADANIVSITEVARQVGFTHMGRFAAFYSQAFGQTPSETVRTR